MSKKQWGHGYYKGIEEAKKNKTGLVGMFVHILKDGRINNQLEVLKELPENKYLLQYYSWMDGFATKSQIFSIEEMREFVFYTDINLWRETAKKDHDTFWKKLWDCKK